VGAQGASEVDVIRAAMDDDAMGMMVHASRAILNSGAPKEAVVYLHENLTGFRILAYLGRHSAVLTNSHFVYTSGMHGTAYINMREVAPHAVFMGHVGMLMAARLRRKHPSPIEVVVGPETLGRTLAQEAAMQLGVKTAWCEIRDEEGKKTAFFNPKLGFEKLVRGKVVAVVDDLLTTGSSVEAVVKLLEGCGAIVRVVCVAVRRTPDVTADSLGVPELICLADVEGFSVLSEEECLAEGPCKDEVPMVLRPGHGHEWTHLHPDFPVAT
jgi:orotate phosphoribosyltransferase